MLAYTHQTSRAFVECALMVLYTSLRMIDLIRAQALRDGPVARVQWADDSISRVESQVRRILLDLILHSPRG